MLFDNLQVIFSIKYILPTKNVKILIVKQFLVDKFIIVQTLTNYIDKKIDLKHFDRRNYLKNKVKFYMYKYTIII